ncbi:hypothetical protein MILUP08_42066 [Micromonospora lupini str. Lupac 08]|uniref:Uncharacterized protein n=1 Tax=Micromonospora lupini str. Lupac 08 TaxID=1150864 RepID=I0KZZ9_9ACTN|nr:hypothetical protein MILUP08_42066 [Micromonospora lupini str. Lupac 08]
MIRSVARAAAAAGPLSAHSGRRHAPRAAGPGHVLSITFDVSRDSTRPRLRSATTAGVGNSQAILRS